MKLQKRWEMVRARQARGWSQTHLATVAGVSLSTVSRTENATHAPRSPEASRMADALGITTETLLVVTSLVPETAPKRRAPPARTRPARTSGTRAA